MLGTGLPEIFNLLKKKKKQCLQSIIRQNAVKWDLCYFAHTDRTQYHRLGEWNRNLFSSSFGTESPRLGFSSILGFRQQLFSWLVESVFPPCPHMAFPWFLWMERKNKLSDVFPYKDTNPMESEPWSYYFTSPKSLEALPPNTATLWLRALTYEFWGNIFSS